ncbi:hypothetical protein G3A_18560 [Bacillus sp. 17376]|nr:hypothetical protein G3A_18560 [Bacillus sp. 17376]
MGVTSDKQLLLQRDFWPEPRGTSDKYKLAAPTGIWPNLGGLRTN